MTEATQHLTASHAVPTGGGFRGNLALSLVFVLVFCVFYGGADYISGQAETRYQLAFEFERQLPFRPEMALAYLSITPLLCLALIIFPRPRELFPLAALLSLQIALSALFFVSLPIEEVFPPKVVDGPWAAIFNLADALNLEHNDLPALHVSLSFSAAIAYRKKLRGLPGLGFLAWGGIIALSAWLTHQHHLVDIVGGALLAAVMVFGLYPRFQRPAFVEAASVEWYCLREFFIFSKRHRRYLIIALALYWRALFRWRATRILRVGFCFLQIVDDLLDGDRPSDREAADVAADLLGQIRRGDFTAEPVSLLAKTLVRELDSLPAEGDDPRKDLIELIEHMMVDRHRVREGGLLSAEDLRAHHRKTFRLSLNLLLMASHAELRAADARHLIEALGWCSTMRDLREDLEHGLINIPAEIVGALGSKQALLKDFERLIETEAMRSWFREELARALDHLRQSAAATEALEGRRGVRTLEMFRGSILRFARRFNRQYRLGRIDV